MNQMNFTWNPQYKRGISFLLILMLAITGTMFGPLPLTVEATSPPIFYRPGDPVIIDSTITFSGISSNPDSASVIIQNYQSGDNLVFSTIHGITGSFNSTNGKLTLSGTATLTQYEAALGSVKFSTTSNNNTNRTIDFSIGSALYFSGTGHYYEFVSASSSITWSAAKADAEARTLYGRPGYLATLTSGEENAFVATKAQSIGWIGARDYGRNLSTGVTEGTYGDWRWATGPEAGTAFYSGYTGGSSVNSQYNAWASGEPNNWSRIEWVAHIYQNGTWNDFSPTNLQVRGYVVEYGVPGDSPLSLTQTRTVQVKPAPRIVTFDKQGSDATVNPTTQSAIAGETYGTLPIPTRTEPGYIFGGWFTGTNGSGVQITSASTFSETGDQTLYAKWNDIQPPTTRSGVTIDAITSASRVISYSPSTDNHTTSSALLYKVVYSTSDNINTTEEALAAPNQLAWAPYEKRNGWAPYRTAFVDYNHAISGLTPNTQYWFNVLVKDEAGNLSLYQSAASTAGISSTIANPNDITPPAVVSPAVSEVTSTGIATVTTVGITWPRATDETTPQNAVEYMVLYSTNSAMESISEALRNGNPVSFPNPQDPAKRNEWTTFSADETNPTVTISSLRPDTTYYITVIAKDGEGNAMIYAKAEIATPGYTKPTPGAVYLTGEAESGYVLTGHYTYGHQLSYEEKDSIYTWYSYDSATSTDETVIRTLTRPGGATGDALLLTNTLVGKYISFEVTPVATENGISIAGSPVESARVLVKPINTVPVAQAPSINGSMRVGATLTGAYTYQDADSDLENSSIYTWYRSEDSEGTAKTAITGAALVTYTLTSDDLEKYISFSVKPVASTGAIEGLSMESALSGPIAAASSGRNSSSRTTDLPVPVPVINPANNEVNGQSAIENTRTENKDGGSQTIVSLDPSKMNTMVNQMEKGSTLLIPALGGNTTGADSTRIRMNVGQVDQLFQQDITLKVDNGQVQYKLPPQSIDVVNLVAKFGNDVKPSNIEFDITISDAPEKMLTVVQDTAAKDGYSILLPPIEFYVTATYNGKTVTINQFEQHVTREIALPSGVDPRKITTAIVVKEDGSTYHVPTDVKQLDGKWYARISSLTNSVYTLIYNEANFSDIKGRWFEKPVTEAASRTILAGYADGTFQGTQPITRAEFAAMIVNTIGLESIGASNYPDVTPERWFYGAVSRASEYQVVSGRLNGTFDPKAPITRQEAMIMMQRAAELCGLITASKDLAATYSDSSKVSAWAKDAVNFNLNSGLITGNNGELKPRDNITRAEAAVVILRLLQKSEMIDIRTQL